MSSLLNNQDVVFFPSGGMTSRRAEGLLFSTLENKEPWSSALYSASSLKSGFFSFLVKVADSAIISQVCVIES